MARGVALRKRFGAVTVEYKCCWQRAGAGEQSGEKERAAGSQAGPREGGGGERGAPGKY